MARQRLTKRVAEDLTVKGYGDTKEGKGSGIDNDPYNMNDTGHEKNDPKRDEYARSGDDPYGNWAEKPHDKDPAVDDKKREETGHAPLVDRRTASEAVASARKLEEKAVKCIVASQRILPGATDEEIEEQAADLMHLPDQALNSTLRRQEKLAQQIGNLAGETAEQIDPEILAKQERLASLKKEAEELEKELSASDDSDDEDDKESCKKSSDDEDDKDEEEKDASESTDEKDDSEEDSKDDSDEESKEAAKEEDEDDKKDEDEKDDSDESEKEASETSLLDSIFSEATSSPVKKGASKMSGLVKKQASESNTSGDLSGLWGVPPDVSDVFGS